MKLYSSEIRWFSENDENLFKIYEQIPGKDMFVEERTDQYFLTESEDLGIKMRGGGDKMEVKWLTGSREPYLLNGTELGIIENWIKSGFQGNEEFMKTLPDLSLDLNNWIKVHKIRYKKRFDLSDKMVIPIVGEIVGYSDCDLEFTEVIVNNKKKYFTIGFESLGNIDKSRSNLEKTLVYCSEYFNTETLRNCASVSYPSVIKECFDSKV